MLQYTLLFLEIVLLGATAYVYWTTRKVVEEAEMNTGTPLPQPGWVQNHATVTQMVQDVTELMTELQSVANVTRDDIFQQREKLQTLLQQAETTMSDLQQILEHTRVEPVLPEANSEPVDTNPELKITQTPEITVPLELIYSPSNFGEYLRLSGCGQEVVKLAAEHAQEFVLWFTGQFDDDAVLPHRVEEQDVARYLEHLEAKRYDLDTIKRRYVALRAYINWVNNIAYLDEEPEAQPIAPVEEEAARHSESEQAANILRGRMAVNGNSHDTIQAGVEMPAVPPLHKSNGAKVVEPGADRYKTVFALAEQGLDQLAIAARTGLEQEVVRMLLVMKRAQPA